MNGSFKAILNYSLALLVYLYLSEIQKKEYYEDECIPAIMTTTVFPGFPLLLSASARAWPCLTIT